MAIKVYGVESDLDMPYWNYSEKYQSLGAGSEAGIISGFVPSVSTGTRLVSYSPGVAFFPGGYAVSDAAVVVASDANSSGNPRIDTGALRINFAGTQDNAGSIVHAKGSPAATPAPADLEDDLGTALYDIPLSYVTVINNKAGSFTASEITPAGLGTGHQSLTLAAGYDQDAASPLAVANGGRDIELSGAFKRNGANVTVGTTVTLCTLPVWARPRRNLRLTAVADLSGTTTIVGIYITKADGVVKMYPATGTINNGDVIGIHATWLREV